MRGQWYMLIGLVFALIIAVFAVINVESVRVNYLIGEAYWPLILVILGSVLMGALVVGSLGLFKIYQLQSEIKRLKKQHQDQDSSIENETVEPLEEKEPLS
ncbi:hypothetical protein BTS2_2794 [Bacillus sp. TS-2]|nr:hypothetical protein BTS2_2794 [Bacillus sp. TS-2]